MKFDDLKKLHQKKYREEFGYFLVEGEHLVLELEKACQQFPELKKSDVYVTEKNNHFSTSFKKIVITEKQMAQLSETKSPQGVIACAPIHFQLQSSSTKKAIYLHQIQDPGNLGTILRSLAWFGHYQLLLSPNSVDPFNAKVLRSSMGAIFHVAIEEDVEIDSIKTRFQKIACLTMQGKPISEKNFQQFDCYLFGNEARGISQELIEQLQPEQFTIPGTGAIDSLNLANAVTISLYQLFQP